MNLLKAFELGDVEVRDRVNYSNLGMNEQRGSNAGGSNGMLETTEIVIMVVTGA